MLDWRGNSLHHCTAFGAACVCQAVAAGLRSHVRLVKLACAGCHRWRSTWRGGHASRIQAHANTEVLRCIAEAGALTTRASH